MKHISEYLLEITQLQLRLQDQINSNYDLLVELGGSPKSLNTLATIPQIENDLFSITVLNAQVNSSIRAASSSVSR
ncbi:MAG: hypothetical protein ACXWAT_06720 [Methylobacter sp.]